MPNLRGFQLEHRISEPPPPRERDGGRADFIRRVPPIDYTRLTDAHILANQFIRLNTIYKIVDKEGRLINFSMNEEQYDFYKNKHNRNITCKARQLGSTTLTQLFILDECLFNDNKSAGVIAHNKEDAEKFFDKKIKLAYDNIPYDFKQKYVPEAEQDAANQLKFSNGSYISVGTSMRSDSLQFLHLSEYGKLCAKYPEKAAEVQSGALNALSVNSWIHIESTGEGAHGHFYDMCQTSRRLAEGDTQLSPLDYKFFFYPWWTARGYRLSDHQEPGDEERKYFTELNKFSGIDLTREQRNWYIAKKREQGDKMWREYPSTPDEAFRGIIDGAPLSRVMSQLRRRGHITRVPWMRGHPVHTFWDLGHNDFMAIWFMQSVGYERRFIDYHQDNFLPLSHYAQVLNEKPYVYGTHHLPHDAEVTELTRSDSKTRKEVLETLLPGDFYVVPRTPSEEEAVNAARENMDNCYWDEENCAEGIKCLEQVRYRFDEAKQAYAPQLLKNQWKHGADSFFQFARGWRHSATSPADRDAAANPMLRRNYQRGQRIVRTDQPAAQPGRRNAGTF